MKRYSMIAFSCLLVCLACPLLAQDASRLAPQDALFFASIPGLEYFRKTLDTSSFHQAHPAAAPLLRIFEREINDYLDFLDYHPELSIEELEKYFPGRIAAFATHLRFHSGNSPDFQLHFIMEHNGDTNQVRQFMGTFFKDLPGYVKKDSFNYRGIPMFSVSCYLKQAQSITAMVPVESKPGQEQNLRRKTFSAPGVYREVAYRFHYAVLDRYVFLCEQQVETLKQMVDLYCSFKENGLSQARLFKIVMNTNHHGTPDPSEGMLYVNLDQFFQEFIQTFKKEKEADLAALQLDGLKALGLSFNISEHSIRSRMRLYAPSPRNGLARALFQFEPESLDALRFIPPDALACSCCSFDLSQAYRILIVSLESVYPEIVQSIRRTFQGNRDIIGVDVEEDLVAPIRGQIGYYLRAQKHNSAARKPARVFFFQLHDAEKYKGSLETFFRFLERTFLYRMTKKRHGNSIYYAPAVVGPGGGENIQPSFGMLVAEDFLFMVYGTEELKELMNRLEQKDTRSILDQNRFKGMLESPKDKDLVGIHYFNGSHFGLFTKRLDAWRKELANQPQRLDQVIASRKPSVFDSYSIPGEKMSGIYQTGDFITIVSEISPAEKEKNF